MIPKRRMKRVRNDSGCFIKGIPCQVQKIVCQLILTNKQTWINRNNWKQRPLHITSITALSVNILRLCHVFHSYNKISVRKASDNIPIWAYNYPFRQNAITSEESNPSQPRSDRVIAEPDNSCMECCRSARRRSIITKQNPNICTSIRDPKSNTTIRALSRFRSMFFFCISALL